MQRWPHNARYAMVIYGMLWSAMVCYGTWNVPNMVPTRPIYTNHKSWSVIFRDQIQDWTWRDHVGPRRTTSDLSQRELFGWHTPCELSTSILTGLTAQKTHAVQVKQCQTMSNRSPTNTCGVHGCMVVSRQAVALDISVTLRGCKGSRRIMKAYEIRYCPGLLTRNQQGLWLKMWASWFNMHVIHRHTLNKNIQDVQDVQVPH